MRDEDISVIRVIGEKEVGGKMDECDGVMNEGDKSCTSRVTRMVLADSGVVWEGIGW